MRSFNRREQQKQLNFLLKRFEHLFDGTPGDWQSKPIDFELKDNAKPHHAKAHPMPKAHEEATKKEAE